MFFRVQEIVPFGPVITWVAEYCRAFVRSKSCNQAFERRTSESNSRKHWFSLLNIGQLGNGRVEK